MSTNGLRDLGEAPLTPPFASIWVQAQASAAGDPVWRARKLAEGRELLGLASIADRMAVKHLDLAGDLRAIVVLRMPVPSRFGSGELVVATQAVLGIRYPREVLTRALPGAAFVQVLQPVGTFLPFVSEGDVQSLCLGDHIPPSIPVSELVLMSYRALALQDHAIDEANPAGLYRPDAARWWQANTDRIPLTDEPFLAPSEGVHPAR